MLVIYGLGNNESKYLITKHNAGRIILNNLAKQLGLEFQKKNNFWYTKTKHQSHGEIALIYSNGYMNNSGQVLAEFCHYFKLKPDTVLILQDDSDQFCGFQKLSEGGGTAGHNGIVSIYQNINSTGLNKNQVLRLKIGIRPEGNKLKSETFVLSGINSLENQHFLEISNLLYQNLDKVLESKISLLQNIMNTKLV